MFCLNRASVAASGCATSATRRCAHPLAAAAAAAGGVSITVPPSRTPAFQQSSSFQPSWRLAQHRSSFSSKARLVVACSGEGHANTVELEVMVEGMKCGGCSSRVEAALKAMDHVKGVQVDLETKLATVEVEAPTLMDAMDMLPTFVKTIQDLGFQAEPHIEYQA